MRKSIIIIYLISSFGQLCAQDVSCWVGKSANPDPIMRHHEAFMDAFVRYIQNYSIDSVLTFEEYSDSKKINIQELSTKSYCRIETISSVTHKGCETITISIGRGALVEYEIYTKARSESLLNNTITLQTQTLLFISYREESNRNALISSYHKYYKDYKESFTEERITTSENHFNYECIYNSR